LVHYRLEPRDSEKAKTFPTAMDITYDLLDHCVMSTYSVIKPNAVLLRHSGPENRNGDYLRIHVPLIVPEGDVFLEANGEEVQFSEGIFGFNNQLLHSSHNYTDKYRLVFIIDLSWDFLKLPHPGKFRPEYHDFAKPFTRKEVYVSGRLSEYYRAISDLYREK
jgi:hypothetical protein